MEMNKIALFILYNHHYTKNIDRIEELYRGKFSHVYHLIPFYSGDRENVISVYECSFQFQSYIAQAYQIVKKEKFTHYFVVADDMIINPIINENNLFDLTGIPEDSAYITDLRDYKSYPYAMPVSALLNRPGVEVVHLLPSKEVAIKRMEERGLAVLPKGYYLLCFFFYLLYQRRISDLIDLMRYVRHRNEDVTYPLIWGYSDILLLPQCKMNEFVTYCGVFAGTNLFVEWAIPMAICLSYDNVITGNQLKLNQITQLYTLGEEGEKEFYNKYNYSLRKLIEDYPADLFFIHPIKLSKWN